MLISATLGSRYKKCLFFQAEDGIRDLVRSRGLGDVYKRQIQEGKLTRISLVELSPVKTDKGLGIGDAAYTVKPVSYTHLTLPTSDLV